MLGGPSENPELWTFLESLHLGEFLSGTVAAIEPFGVFVALDDGPAHPVFPGVGFISVAELSWQRFETASDVVRVGQRVSCEFLQFDTWNLEARLSLKAAQPDPFQRFADAVAVGQKLSGQVTKLIPFGAFVEVADGLEGLVHLRELAWTPVETPSDVVRVGDEVTVVVTEIDRERRRISLSRRQVTGTRGRPRSPR
ncbi:S1 RNA-binding domain-containing protein [Streptomyces sp. NPDC057280]|uniref:S1 RNA-binding domain-containing protein n=1 Tax=Streptomyces sp. NPDC057280 TaxID=3346081 RepID=UPI003627C66B